jgi:hypothetical protein
MEYDSNWKWIGDIFILIEDCLFVSLIFRLHFRSFTLMADRVIQNQNMTKKKFLECFNEFDTV